MQLTEMLSLIVKGFWETLYMTLGSTVVAYAIGLPLGLLLILTDPQGLRPMPVFNRVLGVVINLLRSVPFIILLVWVMPVTRAIMGTTIGSKATLSPLTIAAAPFIARMVESSAREVDRGVIEAALSMGASPSQVLLKVILPEAKPSLITGAAIAVTSHRRDHDPGLLGHGGHRGGRRPRGHRHQLRLLSEQQPGHAHHGRPAGADRPDLPGSGQPDRPQVRQKDSGTKLKSSIM